jgi:hypothetical protein
MVNYLIEFSCVLDPLAIQDLQQTMGTESGDDLKVKTVLRLVENS